MWYDASASGAGNDKPRVLNVEIAAHHPQLVCGNCTVDFSYSVEWHPVFDVDGYAAADAHYHKMMGDLGLSSGSSADEALGLNASPSHLALDNAWAHKHHIGIHMDQGQEEEFLTTKTSYVLLPVLLLAMIVLVLTCLLFLRDDTKLNQGWAAVLFSGKDGMPEPSRLLDMRADPLVAFIAADFFQSLQRSLAFPVSSSRAPTSLSRFVARVYETILGHYLLYLRSLGAGFLFALLFLCAGHASMILLGNRDVTTDLAYYCVPLGAVVVGAYMRWYTH